MLQTQRHDRAEQHIHTRGAWSLQIALWAIWTCAVALTAFLRWHADVAAQRPVDMHGLIIYCVLVGLGGLVVMTKIEMHVEPWRFLE